VTTTPTARERAALSRERILAAAVELADTDGVAALTMRALAERLGVEAMSLYYHVANKAALLDGVADAVVGEILGAVPDPGDGDDWRTALRTRILAARSVLLRHPWAPPLLTRPGAFGPAAVRYFEGVLAILVRGGFSNDLAHHAIHALGSRAIGFAQELFTPGDAAEDVSEEVLAAMETELPYLTGMLTEISHDAASTLGWCDDQAEFEFGVDALLEGLEAARLRSAW